jgi:hypothetical protein
MGGITARLLAVRMHLEDVPTPSSKIGVLDPKLGCAVTTQGGLKGCRLKVCTKSQAIFLKFSPNLQVQVGSTKNTDLGAHDTYDNKCQELRRKVERA